jgi:hypothetical protein
MYEDRDVKANHNGPYLGTIPATEVSGRWLVITRPTKTPPQADRTWEMPENLSDALLELRSTI